MKYQRSLTTKQAALLKTLYSFRFSTSSLVSNYLDIPNNSVLYLRFKSLVERGYIGMKYDKSYRLAGREAEYYITPAGLRALRDVKTLEVTETMLRATYKDPTVSEAFIQQHLTLFAIRNQLTASYDNLQYFTQRDIQSLDYFPEPRPTAFVSLKTTDGINRFFIEYLPAQTHTSRIKYRLKAYMRYFDQDTWNTTGTSFPGILYIAENGITEKGVRRHIDLELYKADTDIQFFTTTQRALLDNKNDRVIWTGFDGSNDLMSLDAM